MYHHLTEAQIKRSLQVKAELRDFISPLSEEEFRQLEANLLSEGCREPMVVWQKDREYILVDGHHRFKLCTKHKIDFQIILQEFADIEQVKDWMINNQLGKRNATDELRSYLRGLQYYKEKKSKNAPRKLSGQNVHSKTSEQLAEQYQVSEKTIRRDADYAQALDQLTRGDMDLKWKILNKNIPISKKQVMEIVKQGKEAIARARDVLNKKGRFIKEPLDKSFASTNLSELMLEDRVKSISKKLLRAIRRKDPKSFEEASLEMEKLRKALFPQG